MGGCFRHREQHGSTRKHEAFWEHSWVGRASGLWEPQRQEGCAREGTAEVCGQAQNLEGFEHCILMGLLTGVTGKVNLCLNKLGKQNF